MKAGLWLNLIATLLITALTFTLMAWVLGIQLDGVPDWAPAAR